MFTIQTTGGRACAMDLTRVEMAAHWRSVRGSACHCPPCSRPERAPAPPRASSSFGKAKSCIVLYLLGGPPQHETWDPKPDAPVEIRGDFKAIATNVSGIQVGELMPRTAQQMDKIAVLRAMVTNDNAHSSSGYWTS